MICNYYFNLVFNMLIELTRVYISYSQKYSFALLEKRECNTTKYNKCVMWKCVSDIKTANVTVVSIKQIRHIKRWVSRSRLNVVLHNIHKRIVTTLQNKNNIY